MSKIDFGVHTHFEIEQDEYCFDVCLDDSGASLLINSKEQIFAEKLRSLLRLGTISTRYKDIFDLCYLSDYINKDLLKPCLSIYIYGDLSMKENDLKAILRRIDRIFQDKTFRKKIESSQKNWLGISVPEAFDKIKSFLESI